MKIPSQLNPLNSLMCSKGVIHQHKIIPVKSHEGHTFYGYESHVSSARGMAHVMAHKVHSSSRSSILRATLTRARRRGRRSGRRIEGGGNSVARALLALVLPLGPVLPLPDRMLMPEWRGSRRISSDFLRVRLRHCHLHLLRFPGGGARWRLHAALAVPDACDRAQHGDQQAAAKREPNREAGAGIRIVAGTTGP